MNQALKRLIYPLYVLTKLRGEFPRECNCCGYKGMFGPTGIPPRLDAKCPKCYSLERHRLFKLWLDANRETLAEKRVLHFAPEQSMKRMIQPVASDYVTADIAAGRADLVLNIEKLDLPDSSFDVVVCFHVLEHVDDAKALSEIVRILKPGGYAILAVPIIEGWSATYENNRIKTDAGRSLHFGQRDHVRYYGSDFRQRIKDANLTLSEFTAPPDDVVKYGLYRGEKVFLARSEFTPDGL